MINVSQNDKYAQKVGSLWGPDTKKDAVMLQHVAIEVENSEKAALFFNEILGLKKIKEGVLSAPLNKKIFGNGHEVKMETFGNDHLIIETFVTGRPVTPSYQHICVSAPDKEAFVARCNGIGAEVFTVQKGERELLFARDFSGNLYEILAS